MVNDIEEKDSEGKDEEKVSKNDISTYFFGLTKSQKQEFIEQHKKLYNDSPKDETALMYVNILCIYSFIQNKEELEETEKKVKIIYEENTNTQIAEAYVNILFNLSAEQEKEEIKLTEEKAKGLYDKHKTAKNKTKIAYEYTRILFNLFVLQNKEERVETAEKLIAIYEECRSVGVAINYALILFSSEKEQAYKSLKEFINNSKKIHFIILDFIWNKFTKSEWYIMLSELRLIGEEQIEKEIDVIFKKMNSNPNKGKIKVELINLLINVMKVKKDAIYKRNEEIGHYTKMETLKYILDTEKKIKEPHLRISNAEHMNDPLEGKTFMQLLKNQCDESDLKNILDELYQNSNCNKNDRIRFNECNTYLGSFSSSIDKLPMWSQYGDNGKGCCLVFNSDFFDEKENHNFDCEAMYLKSTSEVISISETDLKKEEEKYVLYNVIYVSGNELFIDNNSDKLKAEAISQHMRNISNSLVELNRLRKGITDKQLISDIDNFIVATLDQIRFLFKDKSYEHEKEKRIIKFCKKPEINKDNLEVPQLYVNIKKPVNYQEIILGPKVQKPSEIATYIYNSGKVKDVTRSSIQYR